MPDALGGLLPTVSPIAMLGIPLADSWTGEPYPCFRAAMRTDTPPQACAGCALYRGTF